MLRTATLATLIGISVSTNAVAQGPVVKQRTIEGEIRTGTLDSVLGDYTFMTDSVEGRAILEACSMRQTCRADVILRNDLIIHVETAEVVEGDRGSPTNFEEGSAGFQSGLWRGLALDVDDVGTCIMGTPLNENVSFSVLATSQGSFQIGIQGVNVEGTNDAIPGAVSFDGGAPILLNGYVASSTLILFDKLRQNDRRDLEQLMRASRSLVMSFEESQATVNLSGSSVAISLLQDCVSEADIQLEVRGDQAEYQNHLASEAPKQIPYGSRAGMSVEVVEVHGLDSALAGIRTNHTEANAREFCVDYSMDDSQECVERTLAEERSNGLRDTVVANCESGEFTTLYGDRYRFEGESADAQSSANYRVRSLSEDRILDGSSASGYPVAISVFQALCPSRAPNADL